MAEVSDVLFASPKWWAILTAYLLILKPTSLLLALFTRQWREPGMNSASLQNAGQWIGYLERCLILTFILVGFNEAIGFLLAAKSIFRFGELSKGNKNNRICFNRNIGQFYNCHTHGACTTYISFCIYMSFRFK